MFLIPLILAFWCIQITLLYLNQMMSPLYMTNRKLDSDFREQVYKFRTA
jgi:hypothetical protein